jgi:pimeloyl-ACP methyl ester carboxylesterase
MTTRTDPAAAWALTPRSVASMFGFHAKAPATAPPLLVISGARDNAIPAWATRFFTWLSGLRGYDVAVIPGAGHLLFHDHLDLSVPLIRDWLDRKLADGGVRAGSPPRSK